MAPKPESNPPPTPPPMSTFTPRGTTYDRDVYRALAQYDSRHHHLGVHRDAPNPRIHVRGEGTVQLPAAPEHHKLIHEAGPSNLAFAGKEWTAWFRRYLKFVQFWLGTRELVIKNSCITSADCAQFKRAPKADTPVACLLLVLPGPFSGGVFEFRSLEEQNKTYPAMDVERLSREAPVVSLLWRPEYVKFKQTRAHTKGYLQCFTGFVYHKETVETLQLPLGLGSVRDLNFRRVENLSKAITRWLENEEPSHICWTFQKAYTRAEIFECEVDSNILIHADYEFLAAMYRIGSLGTSCGIWLINWNSSSSQEFPVDAKVIYRTCPTEYYSLVDNVIEIMRYAFQPRMPFQWPFPSQVSIEDEALARTKSFQDLRGHTSIVLWKPRNLLHTVQLATGGTANMGLFLRKYFFWPFSWTAASFAPDEDVYYPEFVEQLVRLFLEFRLRGRQFDIDTESEGALVIFHVMKNLSLATSLIVSTQCWDMGLYQTYLEMDKLANEEAGIAIIRDFKALKSGFQWRERVEMVKHLYGKDYEKATKFLKPLIAEIVPTEEKEACRELLIRIGYEPCISQGVLSSLTKKIVNKKKKKNKKTAGKNGEHDEENICEVDEPATGTEVLVQDHKHSGVSSPYAEEEEQRVLKKVEGASKDNGGRRSDCTGLQPTQLSQETKDANISSKAEGEPGRVPCPEEMATEPLLESTNNPEAGSSRPVKNLEPQLKSTPPSKGKKMEIISSQKPSLSQPTEETVADPAAEREGTEDIPGMRAGNEKTKTQTGKVEDMEKRCLDLQQKLEAQILQHTREKERWQREKEDLHGRYSSEKNRAQQITKERSEWKTKAIEREKNLTELDSVAKVFKTWYKNEQERAGKLEKQLKDAVEQLFLKDIHQPQEEQTKMIEREKKAAEQDGTIKELQHMYRNEQERAKTLQKQLEDSKQQSQEENAKAAETGKRVAELDGAMKKWQNKYRNEQGRAGKLQKQLKDIEKQSLQREAQESKEEKTTAIEREIGTAEQDGTIKELQDKYRNEKERAEMLKKKLECEQKAIIAVEHALASEKAYAWKLLCAQQDHNNAIARKDRHIATHQSLLERAEMKLEEVRAEIDETVQMKLEEKRTENDKATDQKLKRYESLHEKTQKELEEAQANKDKADQEVERFKRLLETAQKELRKARVGNDRANDAFVFHSEVLAKLRREHSQCESTIDYYRNLIKAVDENTQTLIVEMGKIQDDCESWEKNSAKMAWQCIELRRRMEYLTQTTGILRREKNVLRERAKTLGGHATQLEGDQNNRVPPRNDSADAEYPHYPAADAPTGYDYTQRGRSLSDPADTLPAVPLQEQEETHRERSESCPPDFTLLREDSGTQADNNDPTLDSPETGNINQGEQAGNNGAAVVPPERDDDPLVTRDSNDQSGRTAQLEGENNTPPVIPLEEDGDNQSKVAMGPEGEKNIPSRKVIPPDEDETNRRKEDDVQPEGDKNLPSPKVDPLEGNARKKFVISDGDRESPPTQVAPVAQGKVRSKLALFERNGNTQHGKAGEESKNPSTEEEVRSKSPEEQVNAKKTEPQP